MKTTIIKITFALLTFVVLFAACRSDNEIPVPKVARGSHKDKDLLINNTMHPTVYKGVGDIDIYTVHN